MEPEERARDMGWVPLEEFKGNPENWVEADIFVEKAEKSLPIARGTIKRLESELAGLRQELKSLAKFHQGTAEREYNRAMQDLKKQQISAAEVGDAEKVKELQTDIEVLSKQKTADLIPKDTEDVKDVVSQWMKDNPWYETDDEMADYAMRMDVRLRNLYPDKPAREHMAMLTEKVKSKFPEKFGSNGKRNAPPPSMEGTDRHAVTKQGGKHSYANLPTDAKTQCDKWVRDGLMTQDQYVKDYPWGE